MYTLTYRLRNSYEEYHDYITIEEVVSWLKSQDEDNFQYVDIIDNYGVYVFGYQNILNTYAKDIS